MSVNSRLKVNSIIGQRKAFYRQRSPEPSCARKETVDIDILVTSRNGDRKIMQSIRIMSRPTWRKRKWNQLSQFWRTSTEIIPIYSICCIYYSVCFYLLFTVFITVLITVFVVIPIYSIQYLLYFTNLVFQCLNVLLVLAG